jgi:hypothetical protein
MIALGNPVLEYRLRQVADLLDQAATDLKSSIEELESRAAKGVNDERESDQQTGRGHHRIEEGS